MNISILTVFNELYDSFLCTSLVGRAQEKKLVSIQATSFFSYVEPKERIDAPTFGPGAGMLIKPEVVQKAVEDIEQSRGPAYKIFFSPQGTSLTQRLLQKIADRVGRQGHLMVIASRYEGMDARVEQHYADEIISLGDFVAMGGDLPAMLFLEGLLRLIPGVVGKQESVAHESFSGPFVDYPVYTEPVTWQEYAVPEIVRSGNHGAIDRWRHEQSAQKTVLEHFNWFRSYPRLTVEEKEFAARFVPSHYVALMHTQVYIGDEHKKGTSSVTSIDIHDGARSCKTYGIKNYFIVTPLQDQQKIVRKLLDFWMTGFGVEYNKNRCAAVKQTRLCADLQEVIAEITAQEGCAPVIVATSAREVQHQHRVGWHDQVIVWKEKRPVLFVFGTGKGLIDEVVQQADFLLDPIEGLSDFNHLSVRTAIGIALDRWLGLVQKDRF
jgi:tRNA (guanine37-N1)-methyltransferase